MTELANHAAASRPVISARRFDLGATKSPRWISRYEKPMVGEPGSAGYLTKADATSDVSQADADTKALAALNGWRAHRYGSGASAQLRPA